MFDGRSNHALGVMEHIALQAHMWGVRAFKPIPRAVRLAEASEAGRPICHYDESSPAALAYDELASEIDRRFLVKAAMLASTRAHGIGAFA
jgi:cellulose biosynthesis protein BcsQ